MTEIQMPHLSLGAQKNILELVKQKNIQLPATFNISEMSGVTPMSSETLAALYLGDISYEKTAVGYQTVDNRHHIIFQAQKQEQPILWNVNIFGINGRSVAELCPFWNDFVTFRVGFPAPPLQPINLGTLDARVIKNSKIGLYVFAMEGRQEWANEDTVVFKYEAQKALNLKARLLQFSLTQHENKPGLTLLKQKIENFARMLYGDETLTYKKLSQEQIKECRKMIEDFAEADETIVRWTLDELRRSLKP